jgi:hypothetical protein
VLDVTAGSAETPPSHVVSGKGVSPLRGAPPLLAVDAPPPPPDAAVSPPAPPVDPVEPPVAPLPSLVLALDALDAACALDDACPVDAAVFDVELAPPAPGVELELAPPAEGVPASVVAHVTEAKERRPPRAAPSSALLALKLVSSDMASTLPRRRRPSLDASAAPPGRHAGAPSYFAAVG